MAVGKRYFVKWTPLAIKDVRRLTFYISSTLKAPAVAIKIERLLKKEGNSLSSFPYRCRLIPDEPWYSRGIHRMLVKNYYIYYTVDDAAQTVSILSVSHIRQEQDGILETAGPADS